MRTYISPIGYDTRRVTRPVVNTGLGSDDRVILVRPAADSESEQAAQAVADVQQLLQEIEPAAECTVQTVSAAGFEATVRDCCSLIEDVPPERTLIVSLGGGARDILLPLQLGAVVHTERIDQTLFFSDLDGSVAEWALPRLTAEVPARASETFETLLDSGGWQSLSTLTDRLPHSKSTVIRHVNDLEEAGLVESDTSDKAKRVRPTFTGQLLHRAKAATP